jgi:hypothetical protein
MSAIGLKTKIRRQREQQNRKTDTLPFGELSRFDNSQNVKMTAAIDEHAGLGEIAML